MRNNANEVFRLSGRKRSCAIDGKVNAVSVVGMAGGAAPWAVSDSCAVAGPAGDRVQTYSRPPDAFVIARGSAPMRLERYWRSNRGVCQ